MKKIVLCITLIVSFMLLYTPEQSFAKKNKIIAAEFNFGPWITTFGPSIDLDWNFGGMFGFANGLNLHGSFMIHSKSLLVSALLGGESGNYDVGGLGGKVGLRYFFGSSGITGFFLGANFLVGGLEIDAKSGGYSGSIDFNYTGFAGELGGRFTIYDPVMFSFGLSGGVLGGSATGEIRDSNGNSEVSSADVEDIPYFEIILAFGVAF